jgi:hypothetical protein
MNVRTTFTNLLAVAILGSWTCCIAGAQAPTPPSPTTENAPPDQAPQAASKPAPPTSAKGKPAKPVKNAYTGPTTLVVLPATPMLDGEGKQRLDPDGNLMFNPPVKQLRDKKGHPVFDANRKPLFQTATNLGFDDKGRKIPVKKVKPPRMTPVSIVAGTLTVDGWTGKARLNYDIADLKYMYIYAPGIGIAIVSQNTFPGAREQAAAFNGKTLRIAVDGHPIELSSDKQLLAKKPQSAWVAVDRSFLLPSKFPVFGYGGAIKAPYAWPGSKESAVARGAVLPPPLPTDVRPTLLLAPCPAGMMRPAGPPALPGQNVPVQPCVPIKPPAATATPAPTPPAQPTP